MSEFEIIFYEKEDGTMPAQDFLDSLDDKMRAKMILKEITLAQKYREDYIARERKKQEEEKKDDQLR